MCVISLYTKGLRRDKAPKDVQKKKNIYRKDFIIGTSTAVTHTIFIDPNIIKNYNARDVTRQLKTDHLFS